MARAWYGTAVRTHEHNINTTAYLIQPPSPGFRVTLISGSFFGAVKYTDRYFDTLRLDLRLVRALARERVYHLRVSTTAACDFAWIGCPSFLSRGLHVDFEVLQCD